ncbi:hypothetical protein J6590_080923 [Homalodisca vitripennis]|nr:hypothetical protein J6590_080923 [Homalodisca vitripennis]
MSDPVLASSPPARSLVVVRKSLTPVTNIVTLVLRRTKENEHTSEYRAGLSMVEQRDLIVDCSLSQFLLIVEHQ